MLQSKYSGIQSMRTRNIIQLAYDDSSGLQSIGKLTQPLALSRISILLTMLDPWMSDIERNDAIERIMYAFARYVKL